MNERVKELKGHLETKTALIDSILEKGVVIEGDNVTVSVETKTALDKAMGEANEIKAILDGILFATKTREFINAPEETKSLALDTLQSKHRGQSLGSLFINSPEFKSLKGSGKLTMDSPFTLEAGDIAAGYGVKDVYNAQPSESYDRIMGSMQFDPIVQRPQRPTRVRDLFPASSTSANLIDYFRVTGFATGGEDGNAAGVADYDTDHFVVKPQSKLQFESVQAPVRTIAHWEAAHRNALDDTPQLQSIIDNELMYGLRLQEDDQILNGAGGDNLTGILQTSGIQTYTQLTTEPNSDALRRAATKAILANYPPTGYVLHPNDWENTELQRGLDGQYMFALNVAIGAETRIWRLPVVETPAIAEGTFLVGAFGLGAQIYDRQVANIRIAEQHSDFFVRNAVAILAEQRIALAVKRPQSFVKGTWTAAE